MTALALSDSGGDRPVLLLVHGLMLDRTMWAGAIAAWSARWRCIAVDLPAHGVSADPDGAPISMESLVEDLIDVLRRLRTSCIVVGASLGGDLALRLAIARPELVRGLVLLGASGDGEPSERRGDYRALCDSIASRGVASVTAIARQVLVAPPFDADPRRARDRAGLDAMLAATHQAVDRVWRPVLDRAPVVAAAARLATPMLAIHGADDAVVDRSRAEALVAAMANAELLVLPGCGHLPLLEGPESVVPAVERFAQAHGA